MILVSIVSRVAHRRIWFAAVCLASGLLLVVGGAAWSRPALPHEAADPLLTVGVRSAVPEPVASMMRRACFDCHSNETRWPWYARLPIVSHRLVRDVLEGREQLNWSEWESYNPFERAELLDKACDLASMRAMPPWPYRMLHSDARLSSPELDEFCGWTRREAARLAQEGS